MKFSRVQEGHLSLVFSLCLLVTACNPEEYYPVEELIEGADAYCAEAKDLQSCQQMADICQPAYEPLELDLNEPVFANCVANSDMWNPVYDIPDEETTPPEEQTEPELPPTLGEVAQSKCEGLEAKYLWVMKEIKQKKVIKTVKKVKVCHYTGNSQAHTIIIACPAVRSHVKHHDDYLGVCEL